MRNADGAGSGAAVFLYAADAADYSVKLPVPAVDSSAGYRCPVSLKTLNVVEVPGGILRGSHLSQALSVIGKCAEGLRSDAVERYFGSGSAGVADVIVASQTAEPGELFAWGDLASMIGCLLSSPDATALTVDFSQSAAFAARNSGGVAEATGIGLESLSRTSPSTTFSFSSSR